VSTSTASCLACRRPETPFQFIAQDEQSPVLRHLIESYDRATKLEMASATVLDLKPTERRGLALAA
jgi:hypothetical protein